MSSLPTTSLVLFTRLFTSVLLLLSATHGTDPVYSPQTITDVSGNTADNTSSVTWANLPAGDEFVASSPSRVSGGLTAYYDFMHNFINSVFMKGIPEEIIEKGFEGDIGSVVSNYQSYINYFIGFGICVVIGVLFLLIFPIISCCFCCCRLCGNCGGKRQQLQKDADNVCRKYTFVSILFVSIVFVSVGTICIYINNDNMTATLNSIPDTAEENLIDIKTFVNNTVKQAEHIVTNNFQFVQTALYRDLDNIEYLVGLPLKTDIVDNTNISNVLSSAYTLTNSLDSADTALSAVESNLTAMETAVSDLTTALKNVTDELDDIFTTCGAGTCSNPPDYAGAVPDIDTSAFPDLTSARTSMNNAKGTNLTEKIVEAEAEVDDIPARVGRDSNSTREDLKTTISDLSDDLADIVNEITDINNRISGENATVDLDAYVTDIREYKETLEKYDKYRWYGGVGLSSVCLLVVVFALFGVAFGIFGTSSSTPPSERGCASNCGGIMLMVAASLIFIFSALLMLLTFLTFVPGAPLHKVFCEPVTDLDKLEEFITIYNDQQVGAGNYFLADMLFNNKTIPLTLTGALKDCKDGKGAYTAFKLDNKFDLTDMLNYSKTLDVQAEIDAINIDLSAVQIYSPSLQTQLSDLKDAVNISFSEFYAELGSNVTSADLGSLADEIDTYAATLSGVPTIVTRLNAQATELRRIENEEYAYVESNKTALNTSVAEMDNVVSNIPTLVDNLDTSLQDADNYVQNNGSDVVRSILNDYVTRLLGIVDSYVDYTENAIQNQLGSCEQVWNIYNSLLVYTFCYNFVDCFNGFWFSLGWVIFFFMPSVIFSVKLAKYFRRMDYSDDDLLHSEQPPPYSTTEGKTQEIHDMPSRAKFWMKKNKVSHHDSVDECHIEPTPPLMSEESRDYLNQVPPNLYQDNSSTGKNTASTSGPLIAVTSHPNISLPIELERSKSDSSRNEAVIPSLENGMNDNSFVQESISPVANSIEHNTIFQHENQGNREVVTAFHKELTSCKSPEIENKQHADDVSTSLPKEEQTELLYKNDEKKQLTIDSNGLRIEHIEHEDKQGSLFERVEKEDKQGSLFERVEKEDKQGSLFERVEKEDKQGSLFERVEHEDKQGSLFKRVENEDKQRSLFECAENEDKQGSLFERVDNEDKQRSLFERVEQEDTQMPASMSEGLKDKPPQYERKNIVVKTENVQETDDSNRSVGMSLSSLKSYENSTLTPIG